MIYACLKPIPKWHNKLVPLVYLMFALTSGGILALLIHSFKQTVPAWAAGALITLYLTAWVIKFFYWQSIANAKPFATAGSATGLSEFGEITVLEAPHTSANYLQKEMGFKIARKHVRKLRVLSYLFGLLLPMLLLMLAALSQAQFTIVCLALAAISTITGLLIERWLFFAEADHAVTLYYGNTSV